MESHFRVWSRSPTGLHTSMLSRSVRASSRDSSGCHAAPGAVRQAAHGEIPA
jgi:hypothetical protein